MKKAQGMSLNVVVVAALVVLVLIVLSIFFIRSSGQFSGQVQSCTGLGGLCMKECGPEMGLDDGGVTWVVVKNYNLERKHTDCPEKELCCLPIA